VYTTLSFSPVTATEWGLTRFAATGLAELLDDFSDAELRRQRRFFEEFRENLKRVAVDRLTPEDRADHDLIQSSISAALDAPPRHKEDPSLYTGLLLRGIRPSSAADDRQRKIDAFHTLRRLEAVPKFLKLASATLAGGTAAARDIALRQLGEFSRLVQGPLKGEFSGELAPAFQPVSESAIRAAESFSNSVGQLPDLSGVLGAARYAKAVPDAAELAQLARAIRSAIQARRPRGKVAPVPASLGQPEILDFLKRRVLLPQTALAAMEAAGGTAAGGTSIRPEETLRRMAAATLSRYGNQLEPHSRRVLRLRDGDASVRAGWGEYLIRLAAEEGLDDAGAYLSHLDSLAALVETEAAVHSGALPVSGPVPVAGEAMDRLRGLRDLVRLREAERQVRGKGFLLPAFHERLLTAGPLSAAGLCRLLTGGSLPSIDAEMLLPAGRLSAE
jgi:hypothetical protein